LLLLFLFSAVARIVAVKGSLGCITHLGAWIPIEDATVRIYEYDSIGSHDLLNTTIATPGGVFKLIGDQTEIYQEPTETSFSKQDDTIKITISQSHFHHYRITMEKN
ncbi:hypothetical protein PENTCL1PPCAC_8483, partial [Pristionchus entomophagus]